MLENDRAFTIEMTVEGDTAMLAPQEPAEGAFADLDRFPAKVYAVELEQVECAQRHRMILPPVPEQVEHRKPLVVDCNGLAINHARAGWQGGDRGNSQRETVG